MEVDSDEYEYEYHDTETEVRTGLSLFFSFFLRFIVFSTDTPLRAFI